MSTERRRRTRREKREWWMVLALAAMGVRSSRIEGRVRGVAWPEIELPTGVYVKGDRAFLW